MKLKNKVNDPIVLTTTPSQAADSNERITSTGARTLLGCPSRLDVNTLAFVLQNTDQSAARTDSEQYNSQLWRIQEENAEIQKTQVELLRRMTVPVPKPPVFEGNILEYPKWENAFDALNSRVPDEIKEQSQQSYCSHYNAIPGSRFE
jgi:hypothetical protein